MKKDISMNWLVIIEALLLFVGLALAMAFGMGLLTGGFWYVFAIILLISLMLFVIIYLKTTKRESKKAFRIIYMLPTAIYISILVIIALI